MFCYNDSKEAVAQSVSALCLVNLLKTMVVGSSPDDGSFLFCLFLFYFQRYICGRNNSKQSSFQPRERFLFVCFILFFPPQQRLVVDVLVEVHNVLHNRHDRIIARFRNSATNLKSEAGIYPNKSANFRMILQTS